MHRVASGQGFMYAARCLFFTSNFDSLVNSLELIHIIKASGQRAWLITDTHPVQSPFLCTCANQIYIASIGASKLPANKVFSRTAGLSFVTRIWSRREIDKLHKLSFADEQLVSRGKVVKLFSLCGGIPRSIFDDSPNFAIDSSGRLEFSPILLSRLTLANWDKVFETIGDASVTDYDHDAISSMIFHTHPRPIARELYGQ